MNYRFRIVADRRLCLACVLLAGTIVWPGSAKAEETLNKKSAPLAVIDGKPITASAFEEELKRRPGQSNADSRKELLESLVRSELLFAAARRAKYENDPEVVAAIRQIMVSKYLRDNLEPRLARAQVSDQEAEAYYQAHGQEFGAPAMVHAALIRIAAPPHASEETKARLLKRAEAARTEALALEPGVPGFGGVAVNYSEDQDSRYRGGDIGWLRVGTIDGRLDRKVSEAVSALTASDPVSAVIVAEDGYYIVKRIDSKEATIKPYNQVKDGVRYHVLQEKKRKIELDFIEELKKKIPVSVNSGLLRTLPGPAHENSRPPALPAR